MRHELCICADIPALNLATRVIVVISKRELQVPTNTGRMATMALRNSALLVRGDLANPYDLAAALRPHRQPVLLYPGDDAPLLTRELVEQYGCAIDLVVPDGNWRQTSKMRKRDATMAELPIVRLPPGAPSNYRVRTERKAEGLATIEAIARALGVIEGSEVQIALETLLDLMVHRTLASRGVQ